MLSCSWMCCKTSVSLYDRDEVQWVQSTNSTQQYRCSLTLEGQTHRHLQTSLMTGLVSMSTIDVVWRLSWKTHQGPTYCIGDLSQMYANKSVLCILDLLIASVVHTWNQTQSQAAADGTSPNSAQSLAAADGTSPNSDISSCRGNIT